MQEFYINKNSLNPVLRMELINNGCYDFNKNKLFNHSIQNAVVTFSMKNISNGILKVSKSKAEIIPSIHGCETKYILQYTWKNRDVNESGIYKAWFEIKFNGDLYENNINYLSGNLIIPIQDELIINIQ